MQPKVVGRRELNPAERLRRAQPARCCHYSLKLCKDGTTSGLAPQDGFDSGPLSHNRCDSHVEPSRSIVGDGLPVPSVSISAMDASWFLGKNVFCALRTRMSRSVESRARQFGRIRLKIGMHLLPCDLKIGKLLCGAPAIRRRERSPDTRLS